MYLAVNLTMKMLQKMIKIENSTKESFHSLQTFSSGRKFLK